MDQVFVIESTFKTPEIVYVGLSPKAQFVLWASVVHHKSVDDGWKQF